ncbi:hypothetical protein H6G81_28655 [Scytonema hofmannii FACHB-248]|uniref:Uncharacterized protein n=1 Tax=Scytonema hofmannii FACHB-248 TaxID=1842502 RepID=A0ABR8GXV8_9CYAN|nr:MULTISPECIES: hypothetical protein [Nostocales]MBD2608381.1 hypothetical protein [Scytonema hofmannii FACHB-248]
MKRNFPVWQVTLPLAGVLIFVVGAITTIYMTDGGYIFQFEATPQKVKVRTVIDKRNNNPAEKAAKSKREIDSQRKAAAPKLTHQ